MVTVWNLEVIAKKLLRLHIVLSWGHEKDSTDRLAITIYSKCHASICGVIPGISFLLPNLFLHTIVGFDSHVKAYVIDELFGLVDTIQTEMEYNSLIL